VLVRSRSCSYGHLLISSWHKYRQDRKIRTQLHSPQRLITLASIFLLGTGPVVLPFAKRIYSLSFNKINSEIQYYKGVHAICVTFSNTLGQSIGCHLQQIRRLLSNFNASWTTTSTWGKRNHVLMHAKFVYIYNWPFLK
jgi:hypothetical protein